MKGIAIVIVILFANISRLGDFTVFKISNSAVVIRSSFITNLQSCVSQMIPKVIAPIRRINTTSMKVPECKLIKSRRNVGICPEEIAIEYCKNVDHKVLQYHMQCLRTKVLPCV